ncbi:MAG: YloN [Candidatus Moranbacteria bacterium GW2011_GWF2_34_56]|nr:MAG: YloN [Candidatus Moranbacteria bacterium GW2011_GWF1_34_10]KKP64630.1 MAG: YloN [Candidatus Moranbacteria bacterium GW2011_GWF2_34_56]HBI17125.1 23S rRNA (adenine(2503)-C(2))-methyltransferase RlmN [Candidatus Moranbacteria bacterium]
MDDGKLKDFILKNKIPAYRLGQIQKAIFLEAQPSFLNISNLPLELRNVLEKEIAILPFEINTILVSKDNRAIKALLTLKDGNLIETVLISPKPGVWSACISSQVGCALGCLFCATGRGGFKRNLTVDEITSQVLFWRQYIKSDLKLKDENLKFENIVYMGMGEPFLNWENVKKSIHELIDPKLFGFRNRSISVSTAGVVDKIEDFSRSFPQANLAISLHFADNAKRNEFMKVNKLHDLDKLKEALQNYLARSNRRIFIEYILMDRVNDSREDALKLARFLKGINNDKMLHVNLIRYNSIGFGLNPSSPETTQKFKDALKKEGVTVTIRKSLGSDISGACGQLAGE